MSPTYLAHTPKNILTVLAAWMRVPFAIAIAAGSFLLALFACTFCALRRAGRRHAGRDPAP